MTSRCLHLPYKSSNPRSVRGARRKGWTVISIAESTAEKISKSMSWVSLNIWCELHCSGYWLSSFYLVDFAFENAADATLFRLKWG